MRRCRGCAARARIWIQNPYFIPEPDAIEAFAQAVKRGVDVRVMVPSAGASDLRMVQHAAHRNFDRLLGAGVRIFEYRKTLLHQKVMTVDGVWCAVGSSNELSLASWMKRGAWHRLKDHAYYLFNEVL